MRVMRAFMAWKSTSSSGWEYFVMLRGLLCYLIDIYSNNKVLDHDEW